MNAATSAIALVLLDSDEMSAVALNKGTALLPIELPTIQNWSCHNCGGCCRQHLIEITDEERQRIESQKWTAQDGIAVDQPVVVSEGGWLTKKRHRLAHRSDGACVFLDDRGLCRIHAKFGEAAKPLACRIYPYAFHPAGHQITVSLRFSCPSVVQNRGRTSSQNKDEIKKLSKLVVPPGADRIPPPAVSSREHVEWPDFLRITDALHELVGDPSQLLVLRLFRTLRVVDHLEQATLKVISGSRLDDLLEILVAAVSDEDVAPPHAPPAIAALHFRLLVAHYVRKDTGAHLNVGWLHRWQLLRAALKFAKGQGVTPVLQDGLAAVPFAAIEKPFGPLPEGADSLLTRYLQVKIQGQHFCGKAYYDVPLIEGFRSLLLIIPAVLWIARWRALSENRSTLELSDIEAALAIADHHHGYSPVFGSPGFRQRVKFLGQTGEIGNLLLWYAR